MAVVRYLVTDVDAALAFYHQLLGSIGEQWGPPFRDGEARDLTLWLSGPGSSASRPLSSGCDARFGRMEQARARDGRSRGACRQALALRRALSRRCHGGAWREAVVLETIGKPDRIIRAGRLDLAGAGAASSVFLPTGRRRCRCVRVILPSVLKTTVRLRARLTALA
jgi:hypothetical protein